MTVHLLGLPHTETTRDFEFCAYTAKVRKLATMLTALGERVILYAGEANEAEVADHVVCASREEQAAWWPEFGRGATVFNDFDDTGPGWQTFNARAAAVIRKRAESGDILAISMGTSHKPVSEALDDLDLLRVETGVGYPGVWAPYRVYESWAWRHFLASREPADDVRFFDTVIPNFFEPAAFPAGHGDGGYYLFMGRLIGRKGPQIAAAACERLGAKLVVAGQGARSWSRELIVCDDGTELRGDVEYVGVVGPDERARLMGGAIASFTPTMYLEPFGGVSVEAQLTGTPAIVSDWGGLTENVIDGETGYRCSTLAEFTRAAERAGSLDRARIREHAIAMWSTEVIGPRYLAYFDRLRTLYGEGWYA